MQKKSGLARAASISYLCVVVLFALVFVYIFAFEKLSVYAARETRSYKLVDDVAVRTIEDAQAPAGIRKEYSWVLDAAGTNENSLGFYIIHQYAQVYFDDELMYSLMPDERNRITRGVSSNWVMIPVYPEDSGKEVRVVLTPVYRNVEDVDVEFAVGSRYSIYMHQLRQDFMKLILSGLCVLIGMTILIAQLILIGQKRTQNWDVFWLSCFSTMLGIWKIADTRFSPLLFRGNPLALGYIAIGMLYLALFPPLFYERGRTSDRGYRGIVVMILVLCAVSTAVMLCQLFSIAELKQTLIVSHVSIIFAVLTVFIAILSRRRQGRRNRNREGLFFIVVLVFGVLMDIVLYYVLRNSSNLIFTMLAFPVYTVISFIRSLSDVKKRANIDQQTGFLNKSRWNQLIDSMLSAPEPFGIIMFDLNRLKFINDTMGHEVGDRMILGFSNILRSSIPHSYTICRWGGDEFVVLVTEATREKIQLLLMDIRDAAAAHNASGEKPEIYYAAGYALSTQFPGATRTELMQKADEQMYLNKKRWYKENLNASYHGHS